MEIEGLAVYNRKSIMMNVSQCRSEATHFGGLVHELHRKGRARGESLENWGPLERSCFKKATIELLSV